MFLPFQHDQTANQCRVCQFGANKNAADPQQWAKTSEGSSWQQKRVICVAAWESAAAVVILREIR